MATPPFSVKILEIAKERGSLTLALSNNPKGKIQKLANMKILLNTEEEVIAGSTRLKAGTSQKSMFKFNIKFNHDKIRKCKKWIDDKFSSYK